MLTSFSGINYIYKSRLMHARLINFLTQDSRLLKDNNIINSILVLVYRRMLIFLAEKINHATIFFHPFSLNHPFTLYFLYFILIYIIYGSQMYINYHSYI